MMSMRKTAAGLFLALGLAGAGAAVFVGVPAHTQEDDQSTLARLLSRVLSTPTSKVRIGRVEGALSSDSTIYDIRISDADGEWLTVDRAALSWSRTALLRRRLQVNDLSVSGLNVMRRPLPTEEETARDDGQPLVPELPVKVNVDRFSLEGFRLGEGVLGTAAQLSATGHAEIGNPSEGLKFSLDARRQDAPGVFSVDLGYVPSSEQLDLAVDLDEPENGLVANAMNLPGLPPVSLKIAGAGPLDSWNSTLNFDAGPSIGAQGRGVLARNGQIRRLNLDLDARIEGMVPAPIAPVVRNTTQLTGSVVFGDDGGYAIEAFDITSEVARLGVSGFITAGRDLDLTLAARALPTEGGTTRAGQAEIGRLLFDAKLTGPMAAPQLNGTLDAAQIRLPEGALDTVTARIAMDPIAGSKSFRLGADVTARGLALADADLARAVGDRVDLTARGVLDDQRVMQLEEGRLEIATAVATLDGRFGTSLIDANAGVRVPALSPFSGVAGRPLSGGARVTARLSGTPGRTVDAALDGRLSDFATGIAAVDGLFGRDIALAGLVRRVRGGFEVANLTLDGAQLKAVLDGRATQQNADMTLRAEVADLRRADARLTGRANVSAHLTGSLRVPSITADATLLDASAMGRAIPRLAARLESTDVTGAAATKVSLNGEVGGKPARGVMSLTRLQPSGWNIEALDAVIGTVAANGSLRLDAANRAAGQLTVRAGDLDDLSPLALTRLGGSLDADVALDVEGGRQNATVTAKGKTLRFADSSVRDFTAALRGIDLTGKPVIDGTLAASAVSAGGQTFETVRLAATGTPSASDITLSARARGFDLDSRARLVPGTPNRLDVASFSARRGKRQIALAGPTRLTFADGGVTLSDLVIAVERGRVSASGRAGSVLDLDIAIRDVPLSAAEIVAPGLGVAGTLNGTVRLNGPAATPAGSYRVAIAGLTVPQTRGSGLPAIAVEGQGTFAGGRASVDGTISAARAGRVTVTGSAPMSATGALDLRATGRIDAAVANTLLSASGQRLTGTANLEMRVTGTASAPQLGGTASLANGSFTDQERGVRLNAITGRLIARGDVVTIESLTAATPGGGSLSGSGRIEVDPAAGFPADIRLSGRRAQLVSSDVVTAVTNLDLAVTGPLARAPRVAGRVDLISMDVAIPDRLPATLQPLPETRHVNARGQTAQRVAAKAKQRAGAAKGPPFRATLDLVLTAPNRIFVRGRGLNAELGGDLRLTGTSMDPIAIGAFDLRRGRFDVLGQRIDLTRGRLTFAGDLSPELDFLAETSAGDVTARIAVSGSASAPDFAFTSTPDLPQDEVISRLLFGKASGGLSAGQALQLAQAVAQFSGGSGGGAFENLRKSLGVDSLDISAGAGGGVAVGASRYINDRVSLGVKAGANPEDTGVTINFDVTRSVKIKGAAGADGSASGGVGVEREY